MSYNDSSIGATQGQNPAPFTDLGLKPQEQEQYLNLLMAFYEAQENNHGAEAEVDVSLDALGLLDRFIKEVGRAHGINTIEKIDGVESLFNEQAGDSPLSIGDHLDSINNKIVKNLKSAHDQGGRLGVMEVLRRGGAQIIETGACLVRTNPDRGSIKPGNGDAHGKINEPADKFIEVINLLLHPETRIGGQNIYADDLVILEGELDPKIVRNRPYDIIQIPKLGKEIAVCDLIGQAMFVSPKLYGHEIYENMDKYELEHVLGMNPVHHKGNWRSKVIDALSGSLPEAVQKVDIEKFSTRQKSAKMRLSPTIIALSMLKYAANPKLGNGKLPSDYKKTKAVGLPNDNYSILRSACRYGHRGMRKGMALTAIAILYGWDDKEKLDKDIKAFNLDRTFPLPLMSEEEAIDKRNKRSKALSPAIIALSMLKHAADPKLGNGKLPSLQTETKPPDLPNENYSALYTTGRGGHRDMRKGMVLTAITILYGWDDREKLDKDIKTFNLDQTFPSPLMSEEEAIERHTALKDDKSELSPAIIALSMLKYAADPKLGNGKLPSETTKTEPPGLPKESYEGISMNGRKGTRNMPKGLSINKIKQICGWVEEGQYLPKGSFIKQLEKDMAYINKHGKMSNELIEAINEGVKDHIATLETKTNATSLSPESERFPF